MSEQIEQGLTAGAYTAVEQAIFHLKSEELREYYACCLLWHRSGSQAALSQVLCKIMCHGTCDLDMFSSTVYHSMWTVRPQYMGHTCYSTSTV